MSNTNSQQSFAQQLQLNAELRGGPPAQPNRLYSGRFSLAELVGSNIDEITMPFQSKFAPNEMRQLALAAHNHMKPAMKQFIETYSEILKKFRITGTETTMKMCKSMWGEDDLSIQYGLTCTPGPLGGDAQIAALMCMEDLGGMIFFLDPLSAHPHQADIDSLLRLANCGNIVVCPNPASASSMMHTLRSVLIQGHRARGMIPSFFETLESPAVERYKHQQAMALAHVIKTDSLSDPAPQAAAAAASVESQEEKKAMEEGRGRRSASTEFEDTVEEAPSYSALEQGLDEPELKLSYSTIDQALFEQRLPGGLDHEILLSAELDTELLSAEVDNEDYSKDGGKEEEDVVITPFITADTAPALQAQAQAQEELVEIEDANRNNTMAVPLPSISHMVRELDRIPMAMGQSFMLDYSTHLHALMELDDEDKDDDSEGGGGGGSGGGGGEVAASTITKAKIKAKSKMLKDLFGFKPSSSTSSKGKGRMDVLSKSMRKLVLTSPRQHSEKVNAAAREQGQGEHKDDLSNDEEILRIIEQRTDSLEQGQSELLVLVKKQMELIEMLKDQYNQNHT